MNMNVLALYRQMSALPMGRSLFSMLFSLKAPYFRTIGAVVQDLKPGHASVSMKHTW